MDTDGKLRPLDRSDALLEGGRAIVLCGARPEEQQRLAVLTGPDGLSGVRLLVAGQAEADQPLRAVTELPDRHGLGHDSPLPRAVILSGLSGREVHAVMAVYRGLGLPRPLWATLTPTSARWPLRQLLSALAAEDAAVRGPGA